MILTWLTCRPAIRPSHVSDKGVLGVDSFSILSNHRSFQKLAVSPGVLMVFWKDSDPWVQNGWTCPPEKFPRFRARAYDSASLARTMGLGPGARGCPRERQKWSCSICGCYHLRYSVCWQVLCLTAFVCLTACLLAVCLFVCLSVCLGVWFG